MADRSPLFSTKGGTQIGYVENGAAFDLSGRRRCDYNAATGNLSDPVTEKIVAYVSKEGSFVVPSRIAAELFEQPGDSEASTPSSATEGMSLFAPDDDTLPHQQKQLCTTANEPAETS